jgi:hypothetical protein
MGSNALLLLTSRTKKNSKISQKQTLLPHHAKGNAKECIIVFDFDVSFTYPASSQYPILFLISEEREILLKDTDIFKEIVEAGQKIHYYKHAKHISFLIMVLLTLQTLMCQVSLTSMGLWKKGLYFLVKYVKISKIFSKTMA